MTTGQTCISLFTPPAGVRPAHAIQHTPTTFPKGSLRHTSALSWIETCVVTIVFLMCTGVPLFLACAALPILYMGTNTQRTLFCATILLLALHPLPKRDPGLVRRPWVAYVIRCMYR